MLNYKAILLVIFIMAFSLIMGSVSSLAAVITDESSSIWYPRGTTPTFILSGDSFKVEVKTSEELPTKGWKAVLYNDLKSWDATVEAVELGRINAGRSKGYTFTIKSSEKLPPELLSLELKHGKSSLISTRCVKVEKSFDESFYILHFSDEHMSLRDGDNYFGIKDWVAPTVNLINPRFAIYTGDDMVINYDGGTVDDPQWIGVQEAEENMKHYREKMLQYTAPTVVIPGNHDTGWTGYQSLTEARRLWDEIMGQRALSFRMGAFYVGCVEWTLHDYYSWSQNEYKNAYNDETITYHMLASHGYDGLSGWTTVTSPSTPADIMLVGHGHNFKTVTKDPYPVFMSGASREQSPVGFFNFKKDGESWTCDQVTSRKEKIDYFNLYDGDRGAEPTVFAEYSKENDGTNSSNTVTITNKINQQFYDGRIRFEMPKGKYEVEGGKVLDQYNYGKNKTAVLVSVDIKPSATTAVEIFGARGGSAKISNKSIALLITLVLTFAAAVIFIIRAKRV